MNSSMPQKSEGIVLAYEGVEFSDNFAGLLVDEVKLLSTLDAARTTRPRRVLTVIRGNVQRRGGNHRVAIQYQRRAYRSRSLCISADGGTRRWPAGSTEQPPSGGRVH